MSAVNCLLSLCPWQMVGREIFCSELLAVLVVVFLFENPFAGFVEGAVKLSGFFSCDIAIGLCFLLNGSGFRLSLYELTRFLPRQFTALDALPDSRLLVFLTGVDGTLRIERRPQNPSEYQGQDGTVHDLFYLLGA
jgi:hypothetical protein